MEYIIDELMRDTINIELFGDIDDDGRQQKYKFNNIKCYVEHKSKIKYLDENKSINLNGAIYIKGRLGDGKTTDGKIEFNNDTYKIVGYREYRDIFSDDIVYTKLEVV
jgi:hypothetical protein